MIYPIAEIFTSIQGEGPDAGLPANFIRLAGCNLKCDFCDTDHAKKKHLTEDQIMEQLNPDIHLVVITGGEPFIHDLYDLVYLLTRTVHRVSIESNGTLGHGRLRGSGAPHFQLIVSPKYGAGIHSDAGKALAWKYIISTDLPIELSDGLPQNCYIPVNTVPKNMIFLQPMDTISLTKNKANMKLAAELCIEHGYRLSIQMHKVVGLP